MAGDLEGHGIEPVSEHSSAGAISTTKPSTAVSDPAASTVDAMAANASPTVDAVAAAQVPASAVHPENDHDLLKQPLRSSAAIVRQRVVQHEKPTDSAHPSSSSTSSSGYAVHETSSLPPWISRFVALPPEIQMMILEYLDFGDIERLRRTCHFLRHHISKPMMRAIFRNHLLTAILYTCTICLRYAAFGDEIVVSEFDHPRYPFTSRCIRCLQARDELAIDTKYTLACGIYAYVCRLCGSPVMFLDGATDERHFHANCFHRYMRRGMMFYLAGFTQGIVHIIGTSLCWSFYNRQPVTLGCTTGIFVMAIWGFLLFFHRQGAKMNHPTRTWHWSLIVELGILASWLVVVYDIAYPMNGARPRLGAPGVTTLTFVALNIIVRFMNVLGFTLLVCEVKYWRRARPGTGPVRRFLAKFVTLLFVWTYPDAVYQPYPAVWAKTPPLWKERRSPLSYPSPVRIARHQNIIT